MHFLSDKKKFDGSARTVVFQGIKFTLQFLTTLFLVRFYVPADYGRLAIVLLVLAVIDLIRDFGLSDFHISQVKDNQFHAATILKASILHGLGAFLILVAIAFLCQFPFSAIFYGHAFLIVSCVPTLNGISNFFRTELIKNKRNATYWTADLSATLLASVFILSMVKMNASQFLLVLNIVLNAILLFIFLILLNAKELKKYQNKQFDWKIYRSLLNFGFNRIVVFAGQNMDTFFIGTILGTSSLGIYNKAFQLIFAPLQQTSTAVGNLAITTGTNSAQNLNKLSESTKIFHHQYQLIVIPPLLFLAAFPQPIILMLFGPNWISVSSLVPFLSLGGVFYLNLMLVNWLLLSTQQSDQLLRMNLLINLMLIASYVFATSLGINVVCLSILCVYLSSSLLFALWQSLQGQKGFLFYFDSLIRILVSSGLALMIVTLVSSLSDIHRLPFAVLWQFLVFITTYIAFVRIAAKILMTNQKLKMVPTR